MKHRRADSASRHRTYYRLLAALIVLTLGACGGDGGGVRPGDAFWLGAGMGYGQSTVLIDEPIFLGLDVLRANPGTHPIHLLRAVVLGVPPGLVVDHVWAESISRHGGTGLGTQRGTVVLDRARPYLHDVSEVTLDPMCGPAAKCVPQPSPSPPDQDWYLAVQAHISRAGSYAATRGISLLYEVDGQRYQQTLNYRIALSSGDVNSLPHP